MRNPVISYIHESILICNKCNGVGTVYRYKNRYDKEEIPTIEKCRECKGSGRLVKSGKIIMNFEPFEDGFNADNIRKCEE